MEDQLDQEFIEEARELFAQAEDALLQMEQGVNFSETYTVCMRCLHTLKGAFGMFGLEKHENAAHHFEDLLKAQSAKKEISKQVADYLLRGLDQLRESLTNSTELSVELLEEDDILRTKDKIQESNATLTKTSVPSATLQEKPFIDSPNIKKDPPLGLAFVVEDEEDIRNYIVKKLNQENIKTADFDDALIALGKVDELHPDIIITDLKMPKMNGMDFITELRKKHPQIPVIIASAYVTKEVCIEALAHGASGIIEKPFEVKDLVNMTKLNIMRYRSYKLLNQSLRHMQFQFSDLMNFLTQIGQQDRRDILQNEFQTILVEKRKLDKFKI